MNEAMFWEEKEDGKVKCHLCPHNCLISKGDRGLCNVRENQHGTLYSLIYGKAASLAVDPIEKKPLYHFHPGSKVLSYGTMGCNLSCSFCQNASLSCGDPDSSYLKERSVEDMINAILQYDGIAWTYNEPTISYEFSYDVFKELKTNHDKYTVYVTNGYIEDEPLDKIIPYLDAMNIDIKAFTEEFYRDIVGGELEPVLDTARQAVENDVHVEVTYLIIPGHNDSKEELKKFSRWVLQNLGEDNVVHFSRFHPDHEMRDTPATSPKKMKEARAIAQNTGLNFVYLGNMRADNDTTCPNCDTTILSRSYFSSRRLSLKEGKCPNCGREIPIVTHSTV
ncbi:MAG: AmmeMemoRadiSam system radical SAM enzyme [Candidatus Thermoplasmatota archaeon]|nr:AmmeMemoRadiSam system radical SAM enzyme [Candidatus Thermoplasmatota archaeon]MBS3789539.1 AmmeMemoRadiSam system radical SAM enzyme [Candidatus Thermoplasmatota archaeon]